MGAAILELKQRRPFYLISSEQNKYMSRDTVITIKYETILISLMGMIHFVYRPVWLSEVCVNNTICKCCFCLKVGLNFNWTGVFNETFMIIKNYLNTNNLKIEFLVIWWFEYFLLLFEKYEAQKLYSAQTGLMKYKSRRWNPHWFGDCPVFNSQNYSQLNYHYVKIQILHLYSWC